MIAHVVLFRPRADLSSAAREALVDALRHALSHIPRIKRAHVGRRVAIGRAYEQENALQFPYVALLEFETERDLLDYLNHPAHSALGEQFSATAEAALVYDYELIDADRATDLLER